jgi:adenylate cyclase class 2
VKETEIKLHVASVAAMRRRLRGLGFERTTPRLFERNLLFDRMDQSLRKLGRVLRVRSKGRQWWLTWKAPVVPAGRHKVREELEVEIRPGERMLEILSRLGFFPVFEYQKYRTEYRPSGRKGLALLDETPVGDFLELEGAPKWIDEVAAQLGFTTQDYVLESYVALYFAHCEKRGQQAGNMVFEAVKKKRLRRSGS